MGYKTAILFNNPQEGSIGYSVLEGDKRGLEEEWLLTAARLHSCDYHTFRGAVHDGAFFVDLTPDTPFEDSLSRVKRKSACDQLVKKYGARLEISYNNDSIWFPDTDLSNTYRDKFESLRAQDILRARFDAPSKRKYDFVRSDIPREEIIQALRSDFEYERGVSAIFRYVGD